MRVRTIGIVAAALIVGWFAAAQAQTPGASSSGDILPALLAEVRGLRVAMEQMTAAGPRVQLALGRLQLQEQRLTAANDRLIEARSQLTGTQRRAAELQEQVTEFEALVSGQRELPRPDTKITADEMRRTMSGQLRDLQQQLVAVNADMQRLTSQENALANEVSTEQARWSDINQHLEDLERSLRPLK
jgi:chromosome segregation ATPase